MTEYQAWRYLQRRFAKPSRELGRYGIVIKEDFGMSYGLCDCLVDLRSLRRISMHVCSQMKEKIEPLPEHFPPYKWKWNKSGAQSRAQFCKQQADKIAKVKYGTKK